MIQRSFALGLAVMAGLGFSSPAPAQGPGSDLEKVAALTRQALPDYMPSLEIEQVRTLPIKDRSGADARRQYVSFLQYWETPAGRIRAERAPEFTRDPDKPDAGRQYNTDAALCISWSSDAGFFLVEKGIVADPFGATGATDPPNEPVPPAVLTEESRSPNRAFARHSLYRFKEMSLVSYVEMVGPTMEAKTAGSPAAPSLLLLRTQTLPGGTLEFETQLDFTRAGKKLVPSQLSIKVNGYLLEQQEWAHTVVADEQPQLQADRYRKWRGEDRELELTIERKYRYRGESLPEAGMTSTEIQSPVIRQIYEDARKTVAAPTPAAPPSRVGEFGEEPGNGGAPSAS